MMKAKCDLERVIGVIIKPPTIRRKYHELRISEPDGGYRETKIPTTARKRHDGPSADRDATGRRRPPLGPGAPNKPKRGW